MARQPAMSGPAVALIRRSWLAAVAPWLPAVLVGSICLAYANSFQGAFVFDDLPWIQESARIRQLWPPWGWLGATSRPVVQLSLALNYALGGLDPRGYHAFNLLVHVLAALTLYGIARRTLRSGWRRFQEGAAAAWLAFGMALIWALHPLQTESVTYIIQRAESLMGLFYLLTLYCVVRGAARPDGGWWFGAAVLAGAFGMGCKPVMVTAPVAVWLYDRVFLTGSFRRALWERRWLYAGLAATWLLLPVLLAAGGSEWQGSAGHGEKVAVPLDYLQTQPGVVLHYLRLAVWPQPLCLDYGWPVARAWKDVVPPVFGLGLLLGAGVWAWRSNPRLGFLAAWFFLVLAPSSSVLPIADVAVEHRLYLPLAGLAGLVVVGGHRFGGRWGLGAIVGLAMVLGWGTWRRNETYQSGPRIWRATVATRPDNPRAHYNFGEVLVEDGQAAEAQRQFEEALRLNPGYPQAHNNLGNLLLQAGQVPEAIGHFAQALRVRPDYAEAHYNLGVALWQTGRGREAVGHFEQALKVKPDYPEAHYNLGAVLLQAGRLPDAAAHFEEAVRLKPDYAKAHNNLGTVWLRSGRVQEAIGQFAAAVQSQPDYAGAHNNLGMALLQVGRVSEAVGQFEQALRIDVNFAEAQRNLAWVLATLPPGRGGDPVRALALAQRACELTQRRAGIYLDTLAVAYAASGRLDEAIAMAEQAVVLARQEGQADLLRQIETRLAGYRAGRSERSVARPAH